MGFVLPKNISSSVADKAKFQYSEIQTVAHQKRHYTEFSELNYQKDRLDVFLGKYFCSSKELWHVSKLVFVLSHGQSFLETGFSINKQLIDIEVDGYRYEIEVPRFTANCLR